MKFKKLVDKVTPKSNIRKATDIGRGNINKVVGSVGTLAYYTGYVNAYLEHNDVPELDMSNGRFYYTPEAIFTKSGVKKVYIINEYPEEMDRGFVTDIRERVDEYVTDYQNKTGTSGVVSVNLVVDSVRYDLRLDSLRARGRWKSFAKMYERVVRDMKDEKLEDALKSKRLEDGIRRKVRSFLHIKEARDSIKAGFFKTAIFLEIEVKQPDLILANDILKEAEKGLFSYCHDVDLGAKRIFLHTHEYYKNYGPTSSFNDAQLMRREYTGNVFSDDTISSLIMPEHGRVGDDVGVYFGIDVTSSEVVAFDLKNYNMATNILVTAQTGQGKSMYMKIVASYIGLDPDYQMVIFDYEGTEYSSLGTILDAETVGLAGTDGSYVNTMVIQEEVGDPEIDGQRLHRAKEMTIRIFDVLFDEDRGMNAASKAIFSYLLTQVYAQAGVSETNPDTWHPNSKDLTFYTIYAKLRELMDNRDTQFYGDFDEYDIKDFHSAIRVYFEKGGVYNHWFMNPISIDEFMRAQNVIYNFGMAQESEESINGKQLSLRQLFASYLTTMKAYVNKSLGIRTVVLIDEMQRYIKLAYSGQIIAQFASGGRKLGMILFMIINSPSELIAAGQIDNPLVEKNFASITSSINGQIIGALRQQDMDLIIDNFGLQNTRDYLYALAKIADTNKQNDELKYCFLLNLYGKQTLIKGIIHPAFKDSPIYSTTPNVKSDSDSLRGARSMSKDEIKNTMNSVYQQDMEMGNAEYRTKVEKVWL